MNYTSKPKSVKAVQWTCNNHREVLEFIDGSCPPENSLAFKHCVESMKKWFFQVSEGSTIQVLNKDWIVRHGNGSLSVMSDSEFYNMYEATEDKAPWPNLLASDLQGLPVPASVTEYDSNESNLVWQLENGAPLTVEEVVNLITDHSLNLNQILGAMDKAEMPDNAVPRLLIHLISACANNRRMAPLEALYSKMVIPAKGPK